MAKSVEKEDDHHQSPPFPIDPSNQERWSGVTGTEISSRNKLSITSIINKYLPPLMLNYMLDLSLCQWSTRLQVYTKLRFLSDQWSLIADQWSVPISAKQALEVAKTSPCPFDIWHYWYSHRSHLTLARGILSSPQDPQVCPVQSLILNSLWMSLYKM